MIRYGRVLLLSGLLSAASGIALAGQNRPAVADAQGAMTLVAAADPAIVETLIARGDELFRLGDVAAARLLYERAAYEGSARAETAVGRTFDPFYFEASGLVAAAADPVRAMRWYRNAAAKGEADADRRLKALAAWLQLDSVETVTDATIAARYAVIMEARRSAAAERRAAAKKPRQEVAEKPRQEAAQAAATEESEVAAEDSETAVAEPAPAKAAVSEAADEATDEAEEQRAAAEKAAAEQAAAKKAAAEKAAAESIAAEKKAAEKAAAKQAAAEKKAVEKAAAEQAAAEKKAAAKQAAVEKKAAEKAAAEQAAAEQAERQSAAEQAAAERAIAAKRATERRARLEAEEGAAQEADQATSGWAAAGRAEEQAAAERAAAATEADETAGQIANAEPAAGGSGVTSANTPPTDGAAPSETETAAAGDSAPNPVESPEGSTEPEGEEGDSVAALIERQRAAVTPSPGSQSANRPSAAPWQTTEDGIRYRIEDGPNGFFVSVYHAPLNIIPDKAEIELECRKAVSEMARRVATDYGRLVRPIQDERIRTTTWRNTIDIRTRCIGTTLVEYRK